MTLTLKNGVFSPFKNYDGRFQTYRKRVCVCVCWLFDCFMGKAHMLSVHLQSLPPALLTQSRADLLLAILSSSFPTKPTVIP